MGTAEWTDSKWEARGKWREIEETRDRGGERQKQRKRQVVL